MPDFSQFKAECGARGLRGLAFKKCLYSLRNVERRPVLCSFKRIEGGLSKKSLKKNRGMYTIFSSRNTVERRPVLCSFKRIIYSLRDVERRPVLCSFKRIIYIQRKKRQAAQATVTIACV